MAKKRRHPHRPRVLRAVPNPSPADSTPATDGDPELLQRMRAALRGEPLELLGLASSMLLMLDARQNTPYDRSHGVDRANLLESLIETRFAETTGLLTVLAELCGDEVMAAQISRELARRRHPLPTWLAHLDEASPADRCVRMSEPFGDGDNILIATRLADGREITAVVYIEYNLGGLVKDAFPVPESLDAVVARMQELGADPDVVFEPLDPAEARARITEAIRVAAMTVPPFETDTWPASRRLIEWMTAKLPEGGQGRVTPEWTEKQTHALAKRFFASEFGAALDDPLHRELLDHLLWFGTQYSTGDPLHWSPIAAEIVLTDWLPRKIADSPARLAALPDVLRAFVRFAHAEQGLRPGLTDTVLATIDLYEPDYLDAIARPRLQGPAALLARMGMLDPDTAEDEIFDPADLDDDRDDDDWDEDEDEDHLRVIADVMLSHLARTVGGDEVLDRLDDLPLPAEPFPWGAVPPEVHDRVREVLTLTDACCADLLDVQYRTVTRRLLADVASGDPAIFRRKGRAETAAAAICWIAGSANALFGNSLFRTSVVMPKLTFAKDLYAYFGLSPTFSAGQRAEPMLRSIGVDPYLGRAGMELGSVRYLTGPRRAEILELRDRYRALREERLATERTSTD